MKILVIGGTGLIGGHAALCLQAQGNALSIAARKPASPASALAGFELLQGDYVAGDFTKADLARFDAIVFAAGNDIRHLPPGTTRRLTGSAPTSRPCRASSRWPATRA